MKKIILILIVQLSIPLANICSSANINGLAVIVEFTDYKLVTSDSEISSMINTSNGYSNFNNNGSVKQFFDNQSNGKILLSAQVLRVFLNHQYSYYNNTGTYDGGQQLVNDVVFAINQKFSNGFSNLTSHPNENKLWFFLIIKAAPSQGGVCYGVRDNNFIKNNGVQLPVKTVAVASYGNNNPTISVICHELGHELFAWTDYYNVNSKVATNLGHYCMMASGGSKTTPMQINPALRYIKGWISSVVDISSSTAQIYTVTANSTSQIFKYTNPKNSKEYYLIEALVHGGYYAKIDGDGYETDEGLAIWYIDETGNQPTNSYPRIKLVQADGKDEMNDPNATHHDWRGDDSDLFDSKYSIFNSNAYPVFGWKDGSDSGLYITEISVPSIKMTFKTNNVGKAGDTYSIDPSVFPVNAGSINGAGNYKHGTTVKLEANTFKNATFINWTENGQQISNNPKYSFVANRNLKLTANFKVTTEVNDLTEIKTSVSPNPNNGKFRVTVGREFSDEVFINIYNLNGNQLKTSKIDKNSDFEFCDFDLGNFSSGVYFVEIMNCRVKMVKRIMLY